MDAHPPPAPEFPPAMSAPAGAPSRPTLPLGSPIATLRLGAGVGMGSAGPAAGVQLAFDRWIGRSFGVGLEGELMGATTVALFEPADTTSSEAVRLRLSLRHLASGNVYVAGTLALGVAWITTTHSEERPCPDRESPDCGTLPGNTPYVETSEDRRLPSALLELAFGGQLGRAQLGLFARLELAPSVNLLFGPTLGVAF